MRRTLAALVLLAAIPACQGPPPTLVPGPGSLPVAMDPQPPFYVPGNLPFFRDSLRRELERRNMRVVPPKDAVVIAQIDVGLPNYWRAVDVYAVRAGRRWCVGRILVDDMGMASLDVVADLAAEMLARWVSAPPHEDEHCSLQSDDRPVPGS